MTGVAGGDIPTMELTAADVGDIADDEDSLFVAAADERPLVPLSVTDKRDFVLVLSAEVFEPLSDTEWRALLPPSPSGGRAFTSISASCAESFFVCKTGDGGGGGCAFVAGTRLLRSFVGDDAAEEDALDFVGDGVPTWPAGVPAPPSMGD